MQATHDLSIVHLSTAEALGAGRAAAQLLRSPACDQIRQEADPDPGLADLARRLSGNGALAQEIARDVQDALRPLRCAHREGHGDAHGLDAEVRLRR